MNKYTLISIFLIYVTGVIILTKKQDKVIEEQKALIELQKQKAEALNKKIQLLESKLKPESVVLQGSIDGVHWDTITVNQAVPTKYVRIKLIGKQEPTKLIYSKPSKQ
jgi:hypothetical protein